ncbi:MAG: hypothetical protein FWC18_03850 [Cystobacterineae bacterium]|nr:hypothetical protein [Cystobacterineae bacterium]MCL2258944.1 hypothetical protein [Cystobacterineae bacterium]
MSLALSQYAFNLYVPGGGGWWGFPEKKGGVVSRMFSPVAPICLLVCSLVFWACSSEEDKLAKQRIFSPESPPQVVSAAKEALPAGELSNQAQLVERIVHMGVAEATERLGAHRFSAELRLAWAGNNRQQELTEQRLLLSEAGGVSGNFSASVRNGRGQGYDILRVGHQVFAKSQHGAYRQRLRDRGMAERMRQESFGVLGEVDGLFQHRMLLQAEGKEVLEGREAHKYLVVLGETPRAKTGAYVLPPKLEPKRALDESSRLRLSFFERRMPEALEGKLWVDASTAVVLKAELKGVLKIPEGAGEASSTVNIRVATQVDEIGKSPKLGIPEAFIPDGDKPQGIAAALERFGLKSKRQAQTEETANIPSDEE